MVTETAPPQPAATDSPDQPGRQPRSERPPRKPLSLRRRIGFSLVLGTTLLLMLELFLQLLCALVPPVEHVLGPDGAPAVIDDDKLDFRRNPSLPDYDANGFRNPRVLDQADIVCLGDSQTEGVRVALGNSWPQRLGTLTERPVYSFAVAGYGPMQHAALIDRALALEPEWVVVALYPGNDLADAFDQVVIDGRMFDTLGDRQTRDSLLALDHQLPSPTEAWRSAMRASGFFDEPARGFLESNSKVYGIARALGRAFAGSSGPRGDDPPANWADARTRADGVDDPILMAIEAGPIRTVLTPRARHAVMNLADRRIAEGLPITGAALQHIREHAFSKARVLVVVIPTKERVFGRWLQASHPDVLSDPLQQCVAAEQVVVDRFAQLTGACRFHWLDVTSPLALSLEDGVNPYREDADGHPNAAGNRLIAGAIAAYLQQADEASRGAGGADGG